MPFHFAAKKGFDERNMLIDESDVREKLEKDTTSMIKQYMHESSRGARQQAAMENFHRKLRQCRPAAPLPNTGHCRVRPQQEI
jgi:hypothetical protein